MDDCIAFINFIPLIVLCRSIYPPAEEYPNFADRSHTNLVEAFRNLQMEEGEPLENGDANHEVYICIHFSFYAFSGPTETLFRCWLQAS